MPLQKSQVHIDAAMTNLSIAYRPSGMIADQAMPIIRVKKESDKYFKWNRGNALRIPETLRADEAEANQVTFDVTKDNTYSCEEYALKKLITDRAVDNSDSVINIKSSTAKFLKDLLMLDREKRVATLLTTSGNYDSSVRTTLSGTKQWNNDSYVGSIEEDIDTGKEAVRQATGGNTPNVIIIPAAVAKVIKRDAAIRELIKYTHADLLVNGDLPPTLWGMKVLIPDVSNMTSRPGASSTVMADVWGKHVVLSYQPAGGSIETPAHAYTVRKQDMLVRTWRDDSFKGDFMEAGFIDDEIITSNISGYLIINAIA